MTPIPQDLCAGYLRSPAYAYTNTQETMGCSVHQQAIMTTNRPSGHHGILISLSGAWKTERAQAPQGTEVTSDANVTIGHLGHQCLLSSPGRAQNEYGVLRSPGALRIPVGTQDTRGQSGHQRPLSSQGACSILRGTQDSDTNMRPRRGALGVEESFWDQGFPL